MRICILHTSQPSLKGEKREAIYIWWKMKILEFANYPWLDFTAILDENLRKILERWKLIKIHKNVGKNLKKLKNK